MPSLHEVELNCGSQDLPDFSRPGSAAGEPIMKERALLQVSMQAPQPVLLYLFARWMLFMPGDAPAGQGSSTPKYIAAVAHEGVQDLYIPCTAG